MQCLQAGECSGCPWWGQPLEQQAHQKTKHLLDLFSAQGISVSQPVTVDSFAAAGTRDRVDLTLQTDKGQAPVIGLFSQKDRRRIVPLNECPQMSPALEAWFKELLGQWPALAKASVRLRVSPTGERGIWLDLANVDVKELMDDGQWLTWLLSKAVVEIGQRYKPLIQSEDRLKLSKELQLRPWFQTFLGEQEKATNLYCTIGSFTQPGVQGNRALIRSVRETVAPLSSQKWLELFCGIGNFTLPLASWGRDVLAYEVDKVAVEGLQLAMREQDLETKIQVQKANVYRTKALPEWSAFEAVLVDPPRSGLRDVVDSLAASRPEQRPNDLVYISCFGPTLAEDAARLEKLGYDLRSLKGVDQFPQTPHCEWVAHFSRANKEI